MMKRLRKDDMTAKGGDDSKANKRNTTTDDLGTGQAYDDGADDDEIDVIIVGVRCNNCGLVKYFNKSKGILNTYLPLHKSDYVL